MKSKNTKAYPKKITKQMHLFANEKTGETFSITDLEKRQAKKKRKLMQFENIYRQLGVKAQTINKQHRLIKTTPLVSDTLIKDTKGYSPQIAKQLLLFVNDETGEFFKATDLQIRQAKKKKKFIDFENVYTQAFADAKIFVIGVVIDYDDEKRTIDYLLRDLKKRIRKLGIKVLGYIGVRDIGDNKFQRHLHVLVAVNKLTMDEFGKLQGKPKENEVMETLDCLKRFHKLIWYLIHKNLYAPYKSRTYYSSLKFRLL
jgi:hypothetical protein